MAPPQLTTLVFARVFGPYLGIAALTAALRGEQTQALLSDFSANPLWSWVLGAFVLLIGLAVVALHNSWANPPAVIISALGWLIVVRGALLMAFPEAFVSAADAVLGAGPAWRIGFVGLALLGLYLTVVGWRPRHTPSGAAGADQGAPG